MLFTTTVFVLAFLPLTLIGFFVFGRKSPPGAAAWVFAASLFFYGYWMPQYTLLLLASIVVNFGVGLQIARATSATKPSTSRAWLALGIIFDLSLLAYFKYANFFVDNVNELVGAQWQIGHVLLPIGISFYTFTQIAFLADTYLGRVGEYRPVHYGLFVTYFPHLVAGPVLHHAQMMPQFADKSIYRPNAAHLSAGLAIFAIGLIKKVVLADGVAPYADVVFAAADAGRHPDAIEAWIAALAYTFQLYFDFSGYSDMAIGLSLLFNIRLPFNFDSPYRATNIIDFWRRWHITLSNFLRDYLYIPLGGNRKGRFRRYVNLALTMLLGGLWHGASWTFVFWGGLHGAYLMANHAFHAVTPRPLQERFGSSRIFGAISWGMTMLAVVVAWVFFRAHSFTGAAHMLESMISGASGSSVHVDLWNAGLQVERGVHWCLMLAVIAFAMPNSNLIGIEILRQARHRPAIIAPLATAALFVILLMVTINATRDSVSAFIYFNF
jgi:alginate O-acetyltransferase complex protein AlgI